MRGCAMNLTTSITTTAGATLVVLLLSGCVGGSLDANAPTGSEQTAPSVDEQTAPPADSTLAPERDAVIVVAGVDVDGLNVTVSGYIAGILEAGGECIYSFRGLSAETSVTATGEPDRSVTSCGTSQVPIDQFTKGTWEITMSYTALDGTVTTSLPTALEIP